MNNLRRSSSLLLCARPVFRPTSKNDRFLNPCDCEYRPSPYVCSTTPSALLSAPLTLCPGRHSSGTVPPPPSLLALTETNHYSKHPGFSVYESLRRKVSKDLLDLPRLHCLDNFAEHAVVRRGKGRTAAVSISLLYWLRGTGISTEKEFSGFAITRSNKGLPETRNLSLTDRSIRESRECVQWYWPSLNSVACFSDPRRDFSITDVEDSLTLPSAPRFRSTPKTVEADREGIRCCSLPVRRQQFLRTPGVQHLVSSRQFHFRAGPVMAKSKFEYVRQFEVDDPCLPNCWVVVRIDGKAFHKFTDAHHYMKPNDERGLSLMTRAAQTVMSEFNEIVLAYGQSDEYSFVFHKNCKLYNRRASKIMTNVVSLFASSFALFWPRFFNSQELQYPPSFDGRVVLYPSDENLRDYLSWRQADCHINNLYNTCFWKLVQEKGLTPNRSAERLKGTLSSDKNELLFSEFNINYNNLPELYRKGSVIIRPKSTSEGASPSPEKSINNHSKGHDGKASKKPGSVVLHTDIIGKQFWEDNPHILNPKI